MSCFTCLIADDHPTVAFAVARLLAEAAGDRDLAYETFNSSTALLQACALPSFSPRLIILDLVMPGEPKRVALVRAILAADAGARIIVYTAEESAFLARAVLDAGAYGYIAKTSSAPQFTEAVGMVANGLRHVDRRLDLGRIESHPWSTLTDSERSVLLAFCRGAKASEIMEETGRTYSTVTTHKYNGLNKLGLRDGNQLLPYIYEQGLLYELDPS